MKTSYSPFLTAFAVVLTLGACTSSPPSSVTPQLTFEQVQPLSLNVSRIDFINEYQSSMQSPYVEHLFKVQPIDAVQTLVAKKLQANGTKNTALRVVVEEASVQEEKMPRAKGVIGAFAWNDQTRYTARMMVQFEEFDPAAPDIVIAHARVFATRLSTVNDSISLAERDHTFLKLTENLMAEVNNSFNTIVKQTFGM